MTSTVEVGDFSRECQPNKEKQTMKVINKNNNIKLDTDDIPMGGESEGILKCVKQIRRQRGLRAPIKVFYHTYEFRHEVHEYRFTAIADFKKWLDTTTCEGVYGFSRAEFDHDCGAVNVFLHQ